MHPCHCFFFFFLLVVPLWSTKEATIMQIRLNFMVFYHLFINLVFFFFFGLHLLLRVLTLTHACIIQKIEKHPGPGIFAQKMLSRFFFSWLACLAPITCHSHSRPIQVVAHKDILVEPNRSLSCMPLN